MEAFLVTVPHTRVIIIMLDISYTVEYVYIRLYSERFLTLFILQKVCCVRLHAVFRSFSCLSC